MKSIIRICISAVILLLIGTLLVIFQPKGVHGKMNLPSCGKEFFLLPVSRFFSVQ